MCWTSLSFFCIVFVFVFPILISTIICILCNKPKWIRKIYKNVDRFLLACWNYSFKYSPIVTNIYPIAFYNFWSLFSISQKFKKEIFMSHIVNCVIGILDPFGRFVLRLRILEGFRSISTYSCNKKRVYKKKRVFLSCWQPSV